MPWIYLPRVFGAAAVFIGSYLLSAFMNAVVVTQPSLDRGRNLSTTVVIVPPSAADEPVADHVEEPASTQPAPTAPRDRMLPL